MRDEQARSQAARLNQQRFDAEGVARARSSKLRAYPEEHWIAPRLYRLAYETAATPGGAPPRVLDVGAGHTGLSTLPFLQLGAAVTAVDISGESLKELATRCAPFRERLTPVCKDGEEAVTDYIREGVTFDIVHARSTLHHIPDFLGLFRQLDRLIKPGGVILTLGDPPAYARMSRYSLFLDRFFYLCDRLRRGNYIRGIKTRIRRLRKVYDENLVEDMAEYHVVRGGVDEEAASRTLAEMGYDCTIHRYFWAALPPLRWFGIKTGALNTFGLLAVKKE